jgi:hypothetical protein
VSDSNERAETFEALAELARRYPHWRIGQLVANVAGWADADVWDAEDGQLMAAVKAHLKSSDGQLPERNVIVAGPHSDRVLDIS